jgi:hypothetical protein
MFDIRARQLFNQSIGKDSDTSYSSQIQSNIESHIAVKDYLSSVISHNIIRPDDIIKIDVANLINNDKDILGDHLNAVCEEFIRQILSSYYSDISVDELLNFYKNSDIIDLLGNLYEKLITGIVYTAHNIIFKELSENLEMYNDYLDFILETNKNKLTSKLDNLLSNKNNENKENVEIQITKIKSYLVVDYATSSEENFLLVFGSTIIPMSYFNESDFIYNPGPYILSKKQQSWHTFIRRLFANPDSVEDLKLKFLMSYWRAYGE